jgi:mxaJ protein
MSRKHWCALMCSAAAGVLTCGLAMAEDLKVCASENEAPYSMRDGTGFENRVAQVIADVMGRKLVTVWTSKPAIFLVRDYLDQKQCDVVMGLDTGDERVLTTRPYYRAGYVFVTRKERHVSATSWKDPQFEQMDVIAVRFNSPGEYILREMGKYEDNANYLFSLVGFKSRRNQYVQVAADRLVQEVAEGHADAAIAFSPEVARYVKSAAVPLAMIPVSDPVVRPEGGSTELQFDQSMGVRKDDPGLKAALDAAIAKAAPQIRKILEADEGIPLLASRP